MGWTLDLGAKAPDFTLKGVDGKMHSLSDYADKKAVVVIVSCNHCPTVIQYEDRMVEIQRDYAGKGVQFIAINSNETDGHPTDSFDHMVERAKQKAFNFPYLRDETQETAKALGAVRTPEVFLFGPDRTLVYHGRIDDNPDDPKKVKRHDLRLALDEVLAGKKVSVPDTPPVGCTVKWWGKDPHWMPGDN
ncbi:MAG: thioredoxin family protein [Armatimonadota bacterium]